MRRSRLVTSWIAVAVLGAAACQPSSPGAPAAGEEAPSRESMEAALADLRTAAEAYQAAASSKDADAVVAFYDESALMVPPAGELVQGLEGVRGYRFGFIETPGVSLEFELVRVEMAESGDIGWTFAIGDITIDRGDDPPGRDVVRDFHTWRRQDDGSWKVVVDMWNSGMPAGG